MRVEHEDLAFDEDRYLGDLFPDEEDPILAEALAFKPHWLSRRGPTASKDDPGLRAGAGAPASSPSVSTEEVCEGMGGVASGGGGEGGGRDGVVAEDQQVLSIGMGQGDGATRAMGMRGAAGCERVVNRTSVSGVSHDAGGTGMAGAGSVEEEEGRGKDGCADAAGDAFEGFDEGEQEQMR